MSIIKKVIIILAKIIVFLIIWFFAFAIMAAFLPTDSSGHPSGFSLILILFIPPAISFACLSRKRTVSTRTHPVTNPGALSSDSIENAPITVAFSDSPMSNEDYQKMREDEWNWFESHYNTNTLKGIAKIPAVKGLRCPSTTGVTGQLYYLLRRKAYEHELNGNMELAVACMRKSSKLAMLDYGTRIQKQELYPFVRILARNGQVEDAIAEKEFIDKHCQELSEALDKSMFQEAVTAAKKLKTDFVIMSVHGAACSECAKYQGRVYSISGKSRKFPKLPDFFFETGRVHPGCSHVFNPFIDGVDTPDLDYTLSCHPLQNKAYGAGIVAFSNRPFVDDRTQAAKIEAQNWITQMAKKAAEEKKLEDSMIEYETQKGIDFRNFLWIKEHIPNKCPKSPSGYRRMKTQNTKNFQILKQLASELGKEL